MAPNYAQPMLFSSHQIRGSLFGNCGHSADLIPEPWVTRVGIKQCECGARFVTLRGYEGHYALSHILRNEPCA